MWTVTLLTRGVAHVIDQGLALVLFYLVSSLLVEAARPGRLFGL